MKNVGEKVKKYRILKNMSRKEFAKKMEVSYSLQMQIELGFKPASKKYIEKFHKNFPDENLQDIFFNQ